jgi:hypothetical protein
MINTDYGLEIELPAGNGVTDARSFARMYGALACGGEIDGRGCWGPRRWRSHRPPT